MTFDGGGKRKKLIRIISTIFQNAKMFLRQTVSRQSEPRQNVSLPLIRQSVSRQSRHDAKVLHAKVFHMSK